MKPTVKEVAVFGMMGAMMYASKIAMDFLPNIHLLGVFTVAITVVYRKKALYPIYIFIFLIGLFSGFDLWWMPHLYLWLILWAATMPIGEKPPAKIRPAVYMLLCAVHGFLYGALYAPAQALMFGLSFEGMISWIIAGIPFDITHGISNFFCGVLIYPMVVIFKKVK